MNNKLQKMEETLLQGIKNMMRRRHIQYGYPVILEGAEGVILRDLMAIAVQRETAELVLGPDLSHYTGAMFVDKSPVLCSDEFAKIEEIN